MFYGPCCRPRDERQMVAIGFYVISKQIYIEESYFVGLLSLHPIASFIIFVFYAQKDGRVVPVILQGPVYKDIYELVAKWSS